MGGGHSHRVTIKCIQCGIRQMRKNSSRCEITILVDSGVEPQLHTLPSINIHKHIMNLNIYYNQIQKGFFFKGIFSNKIIVILDSA